MNRNSRAASISVSPKVEASTRLGSYYAWSPPYGASWPSSSRTRSTAISFRFCPFPSTNQWCTPFRIWHRTLQKASSWTRDPFWTESWSTTTAIDSQRRRTLIPSFWHTTEFHFGTLRPAEGNAGGESEFHLDHLRTNDAAAPLGMLLLCSCRFTQSTMWLPARNIPT